MRLVPYVVFSLGLSLSLSSMNLVPLVVSFLVSLSRYRCKVLDLSLSLSISRMKLVPHAAGSLPLSLLLWVQGISFKPISFSLSPFQIWNLCPCSLFLGLSPPLSLSWYGCKVLDLSPCSFGLRSLVACACYGHKVWDLCSMQCLSRFLPLLVSPSWPVLVMCIKNETCAPCDLFLDLFFSFILYFFGCKVLDLSLYCYEWPVPVMGVKYKTCTPCDISLTYYECKVLNLNSCGHRL